MKRREWTLQELRVVRRKYPNTPTADIAAEFGRSVSSVYQKADNLGLRKSERYMARELKRQGECLKRSGAESRYPKGHKPWNADRKGWKAGGRSKETQFQAGQAPHNTVPVGTVVTDSEGYQKRKIRDDAPPGMARKNWKYLHVLHWERYRGPVPKGHAVIFKDGDRTNIRISNLECVSRQELMRRNSVHRMPKEWAQAVQLMGALNRQINRRQSSER